MPFEKLTLFCSGHLFVLCADSVRCCGWYGTASSSCFHRPCCVVDKWALRVCVYRMVNGMYSKTFAPANAKWLVADTLFKVPVLRDFLMWVANGRVSKPNFKRLLQQGRTVCVMPGGFEEATLFERSKHRVFIKKRYGFIRLALQHGYKVGSSVMYLHSSWVV